MDQDLIVLNKLSGVSCFPYRKDPTRMSMLDTLYQKHPEQRGIIWPDDFAGGISHRLDVPTSGQLLVATSIEQLHSLRTDFREKRLLKQYYFLTRKEVPWKNHTIDMAIGHHPNNKKKMVVKRGANSPHRGKWYPANTHFQLLKRIDGVSIWSATMSTGVMHQIRLHAAFVGLALWGDKLYGGGVAPEQFPSTFALHHVGIKSSSWTTTPTTIPQWWYDWIPET